MKIKAPFNQDGFKGNIELLKHDRDIAIDLTEAITALIGNNACFIKGGIVSQASGNTTITSGLIANGGKLYHFTGGTYAGTPTTLKILFEEKLASGYPQSYFVGDPVAKDIFLERTARVDATGTVFINTVSNIITLQDAKPILDSVSNKAVKYAYTDISSQITLAPGFSWQAPLIARLYDDGTVMVFAWVNFTGNKNAGTTILSGLPQTDYFAKLIPLLVYSNLNGTGTVGYANLTGGTTNSVLGVYSGFVSPNITAIINLEFKIK